MNAVDNLGRTEVGQAEAVGVRSLRDAGIAPQAILERIVRRGEESPDIELLGAVARTAQLVSEQMALQDPVTKAQSWQFHIARMRLAALDLEHAARSDDRKAIVLAARQLDTTCVQCHEAFPRQFSPSSSYDAPMPAEYSLFCRSFRDLQLPNE
jgi:hypothetical protein